MTTHHDNSAAGTHTIMTDTSEVAHHAKPERVSGDLSEQTKTMNRKVITDTASVDSSDSTSKAMAIPLTSSSPTGFLDLSPELRNEIYMLCLRSDGDIQIHHKYGSELSWIRAKHNQSNVFKQPRPLFPSLLATCSLVRAEATSVLYGSHRLSSTQFGNLVKGGRCFFDAVGQLACHNIRRVEVMGAQTGQLPRILAALGQCDKLESLLLSRRLINGSHTSKSWLSWLKPMVMAWQETGQKTDAEDILKPLKLWPDITGGMRVQWREEMREVIMAELMTILVKSQKASE